MYLIWSQVWSLQLSYLLNYWVYCVFCVKPRLRYDVMVLHKLSKFIHFCTFDYVQMISPYWQWNLIVSKCARTSYRVFDVVPSATISLPLLLLLRLFLLLLLLTPGPWSPLSPWWPNPLSTPPLLLLFCKWSSRWTGLLQMIIQMGFLQMTIRMGLPFANEHPDGPAFCEWSSRWAGLL